MNNMKISGKTKITKMNYYLNVHHKLKKSNPEIFDYFDKIIIPSLNYINKNEKLNSHLEISISLITDKQIQKINKLCRNKNQTTDVLSFSQIEGFPIPKDKNQPLILGDILISFETAQKQSIQYQHSFHYELLRLYVHGLYHLLGYDHEKSKLDEKIMYSKETKLINFLKKCIETSAYKNT